MQWSKTTFRIVFLPTRVQKPTGQAIVFPESFYLPNGQIFLPLAEGQVFIVDQVFITNWLCLFVFHRFLYDKNSRDYLYYRKRVAEYRKDLPKPNTKLHNGKWIFALFLPCVHSHIVAYSILFYTLCMLHGFR